MQSSINILQKKKALTWLVLNTPLDPCTIRLLIVAFPQTNFRGTGIFSNWLPSGWGQVNFCAWNILMVYYFMFLIVIPPRRGNNMYLVLVLRRRESPPSDCGKIWGIFLVGVVSFLKLVCVEKWLFTSSTISFMLSQWGFYYI